MKQKETKSLANARESQETSKPLPLVARPIPISIVKAQLRLDLHRVAHL